MSDDPRDETPFSGDEERRETLRRRAENARRRRRRKRAEDASATPPDVSYVADHVAAVHMRRPTRVMLSVHLSLVESLTARVATDESIPLVHRAKVAIMALGAIAGTIRLHDHEERIAALEDRKAKRERGAA